MTNANINSFTVITSLVGTEKFYSPISPYSGADDRAVTFTTMNSYMDHNSLKNYDSGQHTPLGTGADTLTVWSGYQINSLLATKANSSVLSTYATSAALKSLTDNHSTWINSVYSLTGGGGETNTGSNINSSGVGVFDQKDGVELQFRGLVGADNKITSALNASDNTIELQVNEGNIDHDSLFNYDSTQHTPLGTSSDTLTVWSGFQINSLLATKANSSVLSTYATSTALKSLTDNHSTWINSVYGLSDSAIKDNVSG